MGPQGNGPPGALVVDQHSHQAQGGNQNQQEEKPTVDEPPEQGWKSYMGMKLMWFFFSPVKIEELDRGEAAPEVPWTIGK